MVLRLGNYISQFRILSRESKDQWKVISQNVGRYLLFQQKNGNANIVHYSPLQFYANK